MNSYQTLNAAAHISGIPVRHAVAFGQAYHAGHYRPAESFGEMVRRDQIASYRAFPMRASKTGRINTLPNPWPGLVVYERKRGTGGIAAAAAGGTSWLRNPPPAIKDWE